MNSKDSLHQAERKVELGVLERSRDRYLESKRKRDAIVDSAIAVFTEKGYAAATTAQISKKSGVSEPTMYRFFGSKKALYLECFNVIASEIEEIFDQAGKSRKQGSIEYLRSLLSNYIRFVAENPGRSKFLVHLFAYRGEAEFEERFNSFAQAREKEILEMVRVADKEKLLKPGFDPGMLSSLLFSQFFSIHVLRNFSGDKDYSPGEISGIFQKLLEGFLENPTYQHGG